MKRNFDLYSEKRFYHVIIKVPDNTRGNNTYAFDRSHKTKLRELLFWLESIYEVQCVNYCIMSTHAHFVIRWERDSKLSLKRVAYRYKKYKSLEQVPDARSCEVRQFAKRLNNMSDFMANLQKRFTAWYNSQFEKSRRGQLFNHCYKAIQLNNTKALIRCLQYVELNPLRAQMVVDAADYEFSSWSDICRASDRKKALRTGIINALKDFGMAGSSDAELFKAYAHDLIKMSQSIEKYGDCQSLDKDLVMFLMRRNDFWSSGRSISIVKHEVIIKKNKTQQVIFA